MSVAVIPLFLPCILKESQLSVPQPEITVLFWECCLAMPWLCKDSSQMQKTLTGQAHAQLCCSVYVFISWQALLAVLPVDSCPSSSSSEGSSQWCWQGMCTNPTLPGEFAHPKSEVYVFSFLPLSSVPGSYSEFVDSRETS